MSGDKHPFFSVISLSAAFSAAAFVALHYVQVLPLEREVAQLKEQLKNQDKKVKISKEYQDLNSLYVNQKVKAELLQSQLNKKFNIETELTNTQVELRTIRDKLKIYSKYESYPEVVAKLESTKSLLAQYQDAYKEQIEENHKLKKDLSIKSEVAKLLGKKEKIEEKINAMLHGSTYVHLQPYTTFEQIPYDQLNSQLANVNKQIELLYTKLSVQD